MGKSSHTCACKAEQKNITLKPQMGEEEEGEGEEGGKGGGTAPRDAAALPGELLVDSHPGLPGGAAHPWSGWWWENAT